MTSKKASKKSAKSSKSQKSPVKIIYPPAEETWVWVERKIKMVNGKYVGTVKVHPLDANILLEAKSWCRL